MQSNTEDLLNPRDQDGGVGSHRDRVVRVYGPIDAETTPALMERFLSLDAASSEPIHLYISSPGGCVLSGFVLVDVIQHVRAPVWSYTLGLAASMAAILAIAGERGHRYALPHSRLLLHPASGTAQGRVDDICAAVRLQLGLVAELERFLLSATNLPKGKIKTLLSRENYLTAMEARQLGLIDQVLKPAELTESA